MRGSRTEGFLWRKRSRSLSDLLTGDRTRELCGVDIGIDPFPFILSAQGESKDGDREGIEIGCVPMTKSPFSMDGGGGTDEFSKGSGVGELTKAVLHGNFDRSLEDMEPMGAVS